MEIQASNRKLMGNVCYLQTGMKKEKKPHNYHGSSSNLIHDIELKVSNSKELLASSGCDFSKGNY
jgi:hypothetical protein